MRAPRAPAGVIGPDRTESAVRQLPVRLPSGRSIRLDLAYPQWMLDVEVDHTFWHTRRTTVQRDHDRDRELTGMGWRVVRLTQAHLGHQLASVLADVKALTLR